MRGDDEHGQRRIMPADARKGIKTAHVRQADVEDHERRFAFRQLLQSQRRRRRRHRLMAQPLHQQRERGRERSFVFDDDCFRIVVVCSFAFDFLNVVNNNTFYDI